MDGNYQISSQVFAKISKLVAEKIGVYLPEKKKAMVNSRLSKRIRKLGLANFDEYCRYLQNNEAELLELYNTVTTNVTKFFRENHHFDFLRETVFPLLKQKEKPKIRVWSAGCSTGEEPYSLAIELAEFFDIDKWDIKILASDINTEALQTARNGIYKEDQVKQIPYSRLTKYFKLGIRKPERLFKVKEQLKNLIVFRRINLNPEANYPINSALDFIFCRNVFIYFTPETREQILNHFYRHLKKQGYLFLGHSESINQRKPGYNNWQPVDKTTYQKS
jgi:chemotaxis protein methyltransferase CheR